MDILKSLIWNLRLWIANLTKLRYSPRIRIVLRKDIPYACQFASPTLVEDFIEGKRGTDTDPKWKQSGAKTIEEYSVWAWNGCGMACLKMILGARGKNLPLAILGRKCLTYGGYKVNEKAQQAKDYRNWYDGLFYKPFLTFSQKEYGIKGTIASPLILKEIILAVEKGNYVIASVSNQIRNTSSHPVKKSGHLVLIVGYDLNQKKLYLHNPSGYFDTSQAHVPISFTDFEKFFSHKGIILLS